MGRTWSSWRRRARPLVRLDLRQPDNPQPTPVPDYDPVVVGRLPAGVNALNMAPSADGGWLVVDFGPIPYEQGSGAVWHVSPAGQGGAGGGGI